MIRILHESSLDRFTINNGTLIRYWGWVRAVAYKLIKIYENVLNSVDI